MTVRNLLIHAQELAHKYHKQQRYGAQSYFSHLQNVSEVLFDYGFHSDCSQTCAYLHDILEDTDYTAQRLKRDFGKEIYLIILFCTDAKGKNRKERKQNTYARNAKILKKHKDKNIKNLARLIKIADRLANIRNCIVTENWDLLQMYKKEKDTFRENYNLDFEYGSLRDMWDEYFRNLGYGWQ